MHQPIELNEPYEFEWDEWNSRKNRLKHNVFPNEAEQVFTDPKKIILADHFHSKKEERYIIIGKTENNRILYVVFTLRKIKIRVISARDLNHKEKNLYHEKET